jgi:hypothetical protein
MCMLFCLFAFGVAYANETSPSLILVSKKLEAPKPVAKPGYHLLAMTQSYATHLLKSKKTVKTRQAHSFDLTSLRTSMNTTLALFKKAGEGRLTKHVYVGLGFERGKSYAERHIVSCKFNVSYHL